MKILSTICSILFLSYIVMGMAIITAAVLQYPLAEHFSTSRFLPEIIHYGPHEMSLERNGQDGMVNFLIRKAGHFVMYSFLAIFLMIVFRVRPYVVKISLVLASIGALGAMDEMVQAFLPERSSLLMDVFVDIAGGCFGVIIFLLLIGSHSNVPKVKGKIVG